jgi:nitroimidazol reductase NimA-like FMN-containing flavoprotein (pyridoxamine 5'-phosphate oxidase superfamily)
VNEIIAANRYMTLATADADGTPWASPVWYATEDGRMFYWVSDPDARHSRNIAERPEIAIVIFDSTVTPGNAQAIYIEARAEQVDAGLEIFNRCSIAQGLPEWPRERVSPSAKHRLYRATAVELTTLTSRDERVPV